MIKKGRGMEGEKRNGMRGGQPKWRDRDTARHVPIMRNDTKKNIRVREKLRVYTNKCSFDSACPIREEKERK